MSSASLLFQILALVGCILTAYKFLRIGLYRRYRVFFSLLLFQTVNTSWPFFVNDVRSPAYAYLWAITEPITWIFYALAVLELYRLVLEKHRGLYSLGRWTMYVAMAVAILLSILTLLPHFTPDTPQESRKLGYFYAVERGIFLTLTIFILLMLLFLSRYPITLSRNVLVHTGLYSFYFISQTLATLLLTMFGLRLMHSANILVSAATALCLFLWFLLLTRKGEEIQTHIPLFGAEQERRALQELDGLNQTLLKAARR
jgi:hypothetical protein